MLEIPGEVRDLAAAPNSAPALVLRLDLPSGSLYFADTPSALPFLISGSLCTVESLQFALDSTGTLGSEQVRLRLRDTDGALLQKLENGEFDDATVCLLQCFAGLSAELAVTVFQGRVVRPPRWLEEERQLELEPITRLVQLAERSALRAASKADFSQVAPDDEGRCLPLCYGLPSRVPAVCVQQAAKALLVSLLDADGLQFYLDDITCFPQNAPLLLRLGSEYLRGAFSGNRCTVSKRGDFSVSGTIGEATGNPAILRLTGLSPEQLRRLPGQRLRLIIDGQTRSRTIYTATNDGIAYLTLPFYNDRGLYYTPPRNSSFTIVSTPSQHQPGTSVRLADAEEIFLLHDGAAGELALLEGETENGFARVPASAYTYAASDTTTYPHLARPVALVRVPTPLTCLTGYPFVSDRVYATFTAAEEAGNPARILREILTGPLQIPAEEIDEESFLSATQARTGRMMSFALTEASTVRQLLSDLCLQGQFALFCDGGLCKLRTLQNGISNASAANLESDASAGNRALLARLTPATILAGSLTLEGREETEPVNTVRGAYQGGDICVIRSGNGTEKSIPLWAFTSQAQARIVAEWWLRRFSHGWRTAVFTTFLNGMTLERLDTVTLDDTLFAAGSAAVAGSARELRGRVVELRRLPRRNADEIDAYQVELECPQWTGCASSCESSCEAGSCESGGCEMSCTAGCEQACQVACQSTRQSYGPYIGPGCTKTCQISCRTAAERACGSSCEANCENACEAGCELSCEGESFETSCPTGCESATESPGAMQTIRKVRVLTAPVAVGGSASVQNLSGGETFDALDISDLRPQSGDECTAVLTAGGDWVLTGNGREAKFVRITADLGGGSYTVIESAPGGGDWGSSFTAILPS